LPERLKKHRERGLKGEFLKKGKDPDVRSRHGQTTSTIGQEINSEIRPIDQDASRSLKDASERGSKSVGGLRAEKGKNTTKLGNWIPGP